MPLIKDEDVVISESQLEDGIPCGGYSYGCGFTILWPNRKKSIRGAWITSILKALIHRLETYQRSRFACPENQQALTYLSAALEILDSPILESPIKDRTVCGALETQES